MKDASSQLRSATRRAKSDVANKLVSMFLHELSRKLSETWNTKVDGPEYERLVRETFKNRCPYCSRDLTETNCVVEHLDGMNRYRVGLHLPGNVLVACRQCNGEKRRDDSLKTLTLASSGWESFLTHSGGRCGAACMTCDYWKTAWPNDGERDANLAENLARIVKFRESFFEFQNVIRPITAALPPLLSRLYSDCQEFAQSEIRTLLASLDQLSVKNG